MNENPFNTHLLRVLTAVLQDNTGTIPFDLVSDIADDDTTGTSAAILEGLEALVDRVWRAENQKSQLAPPPELPTFSSPTEEFTFLRVAYPQAQTKVRVLKAQADDVRRVCEAVAGGDLKQRMDVDAVMPELGVMVNAMVGCLNAAASEVTRVSLEVGTEGRLGGQVELGEVKGAWRIEYDARGELLELKEIVNGMIEFFSDFVDEITMVAKEVGGEGRLGGQLTPQRSSVGAITSALARGEIPRKISGVAVNGEMRSLVDSTNQMIDQLAIFASEIEKVAREVCTEGKLVVRAEVGNAQGIWREITVSVNTLAEILFTQLRGFAQITAAALNHDFTLFLTDEDSREMDSLRTQITQMVYNLRASIERDCIARQVAERALGRTREELVDVSGEIRTPVEGIIVAVERTLEGGIEPPQRERILLVQRHAKTLLPIIDEIMQISKN
ncbi:hypothetical protein DXG01_012161 [Tephrocybe rancida]|nr:hypothetical protein DXG01_012161 [Tephrocybe rancida]